MAETAAAKYMRVRRAHEGLRYARSLLKTGTLEDQQLAIEQCIKTIDAMEEEIFAVMSAMAREWV